MTKSTDEELLELITEKDTSAFNVFFDRYERAIFNYILKYSGDRALSQELLQETFTRVWFSAKLYQPKKGKVINWLFTIALNLTRSELVKKRYSYKYEDIIGMKNDPIIAYDQPDSILEKEELKLSMAKALGQLKPELREVILLKHFQQLKFREIVEMTSIPEGTLKARFQKALKELRKHIKPVDKR